MHWLHDIDVGLLRFINQTLSNPFFDALMPFASANRFFFPVLLLIGALTLWKGGLRARLCILMLVLVIWPGDTLVCNSLKHAIARPRPFSAYSDLNQPSTKNRYDMASAEMAQSPETSGSGTRRKVSTTSMPSSHAANWFAATMILFVFYRRSWLFMLPLALLVSFSRVYNGVHYPSDVLAGMILGAGYAVAGLWAVNSLWQWAGRKWFPLWWQKCPSLVSPNSQPSNQSAIADSQSPPVDPQSAIHNPQSAINQHWLRLGYVLIAALLFANLAYLRSGTIGLLGDEAYQWTWSKHPDFSYVSKPPFIAYVQWVGTHLWGDNEFGVRFFSPVIGAILGFLLLRFFAREINARAGVFLLLILQATPLVALGCTVLTVDPLSVLFWTAAMMSGWRAIQPGAKTAPWLWTGLWMGLGLLSKYVGMLQWLCWAVLFVLSKPARAQLRRPGPYLALAINLLFALPVLIWNMQHDWIGASHVLKHNARLESDWQFTLRYVFEFFYTQAAVMNPVFFIAMIWAAIAFWRRGRNDLRMIFLFSMGAPLFLSYLLYSIRLRILPNWTAPTIVPLFALMVCYWDARRRPEWRVMKFALGTGTVLGLVTVLLAHEPDLIKYIAGRPLPPKPDPLTRVRAWPECAQIVNEARIKLMAEGKPVFIIGSHYQIASLMAFYIPEANSNIIRHPLVFCPSTEGPENQYYYWPGYKDARKGQNAIYVREAQAPPLVDGWVSLWLKGETNLLASEPRSLRPPATLFREFETVTDLGQFNAYYRGRVFHTLQLFECRNLR